MDTPYSKLAKAVIDALVDLFSWKETQVRWDLKLRKDRDPWVSTVVKGKNPTAQCHERLSVRVLELAEREMKKNTSADDSTRAGYARLKLTVEKLNREYNLIQEAIAAKLVTSADTKPIAYAGEKNGGDTSASPFAALTAKTSNPAPGNKGHAANGAAHNAKLLVLQRQLEEAQQVNDPGAAIIAHNDIALFYERSGAWGEAVHELRKYIDAQKIVPDPVYAFRAHARLAKALASAHREEEARDLLWQLHREPRWRKAARLDVKYAARATEWLAWMQIETGQFKEAATSLRDALRLRKRLGNSVGIGSVSFYQAKLAIRRSKWKAAHRHLEECSKHWGKLPIRELKARTWLVQARAFFGESLEKTDRDRSARNAKASLLESAFVTVNEGLLLLEKAYVSGDVFSEHARGLQLRGAIRLMRAPNDDIARADAIKDYEAALTVCPDPSERCHAHQAFAEFHFHYGVPDAAAHHASMALACLKNTERPSAKLRHDLEELIARCQRHA